MESTVTLRARSHALSARWPLDPGSIAAWLLPVALVTYLGMRSGGYDALVSDQVGIVAWWAIFLILAFGLTRLRLSAPARVGIVLLGAYGAWTALSLIWTESAQRTMGDITLMLLYLALAALAMSIRGRDAQRMMLGGLAVAITVIAVVSLLSRLHFAWFPVPEVDQNVPGSTGKLSYPIGYWNALAALAAIGVPLLLYVATGARQLVWRGLAGAAVPLLVLCVYLTVSRGGAVGVALGVVAFLALVPDRLPKLAVALACGAGSALLVAAANQRAAVRSGARDALAAHQGNELIAIAIAIAIGVALLVYALALVERHVERPRLLTVSRRQATIATVVALLAAVVVFVAAGGPHFASTKWAEFKTPYAPSSVGSATPFERFGSATGNGRYQLWQAAVRAGELHPLTGTGAGTYIYWWARTGTLSAGFVQDAHSLYLQALAELGYPGLVLISAFVLWILGCGVVRSARTRDPDRRLTIAAATAGAIVFVFSAAFEWIWLIPVLPACLFMLAAVIFAPASADPGALSRRRPQLARGALRAGGAIAALAALVTIALPMAATAAVRQSQSSARDGHLAEALASARQAVRLQPYAAAPWLQEALVLEVGGDLRGALTDAVRATRREPTNADTWLVRSRLEARTGNAAAALADYRRARSLDPESPIFAR